MFLAYCVKKCPYYKPSCECGYIHISGRHKDNEELLKAEDGNLFCYEGRFLTIYDKICESCGCDLVPFDSREENKDIIATYKCPECGQIIEMDVIL